MRGVEEQDVSHHIILAIYLSFNSLLLIDLCKQEYILAA